MKNNYLIAIEGIPYSGKTTLSHLIKQNMNFKRIPEIAEINNNGADFPLFPKNDLEAIQSDSWFFQEEIKRTQIIKEFIKTNSIIMDRSYVSSLAFVKSRFDCYNIGSIEEHSKLINAGLSNGSLIIPYHIFLDIDMDTYIKRKKSCENYRLKKFGNIAMLNTSNNINNDEFIEHLINFYKNYFLNSETLILNDNNKSNILYGKTKKWIQTLWINLWKKVL